jgi:hypothetical protein
MTINVQNTETTMHHDAHTTTLMLIEEQMAWLQSLFSAIRSDPQSSNTENLAAVGCFLTDMWRDNHLVLLENMERSVSKNAI